VLCSLHGGGGGDGEVEPAAAAAAIVRDVSVAQSLCCFRIVRMEMSRMRTVLVDG
jgi:hypothetical protein